MICGFDRLTLAVSQVGDGQHGRLCLRHQDLDGIAGEKAVALADIESAVFAALHDADDLIAADIAVSLVPDEVFALSEREPDRIRAVADVVQLVRDPLRHLARLLTEQTVDRHAVGIRYARDIIRRLCAPLDLEGIDARLAQLFEIRQQAEILCIENIAAVPVLIDREILSGTLLLHERVLPAAGLRTGAAVGISAGHVFRQQTPPGHAHAHRAVDKDLDFQLLRCFCADLRDFRDRKLSCEHDPRHAEVIERIGGLVVDDARLGRGMHCKIGCQLSHHGH